MAFTLQIKAKALLSPKKTDIDALLKSCGMAYGSANEFYILEEGESNQGTAILYNPAKLGRGIFIDFSENEKGNLTLSYNIPTTASEIDDFINLVQCIEKQLKKVELYCEEEERNYTVSELQNNRENMISFSLSTLNEFCRNQDYSSYIFTLAMWPLVLTDEQAEECESIFPIRADGFLNLDAPDLKIDDGMVSFYIYSENRAMDGLFDYEKFTQYVLQHGATLFDKDHILVPSMTKAELETMAASIR